MPRSEHIPLMSPEEQAKMEQARLAQEEKRVAGTRTPSPAEAAVTSQERTPLSPGARAAEQYMRMLRLGDRGANTALVAIVAEARKNLLGASGMPKEIPDAKAIADLVRPGAIEIASRQPSPQEAYADLLDLATEKMRQQATQELN